ncbi:MAG: hypothetical protein GVY14_01815 [Spirochaetes bacterium]|jgi:hypothetical protein|nr:hypothetical protein [Spirochaetota bacterium]
MPSSRKVRRAVLEALSGLPPGTRVVDLGAGWGGLVVRIVRERPDLVVEGYERSPVPYLVARIRCAVTRLRRSAGHGRRHGRARPGPRPGVHFGDFRKVGPRDRACYITYLSPEGMKWIRELFERHLPRDVVVVSAVFAVRGWTPLRSIPVPDMHRSRVYLYELK